MFVFPMSQTPTHWNAREQHNALVAWVWRITAFSFLSQQFIVYYLKELGATDLTLGWAGALPSLAMAAQFAGAVWAERTMSRRRLLLWCDGLRLLCWVPILATGWWAAGRTDRGEFALVVFIAATTASAAIFHLRTPSWDSWFSDAVKDEEKGTFFGKHGFWAALTGGTVVLVGGWLVDKSALGESAALIRALVILFALGIFCFFVQWALLFRLSDTARNDTGIHQIGELVREAMSERNYLWFLAMHSWFMLVIGIYQSFQFAWFKTELKLDLTFLGVLGALAALTTALCSRWFGALARRFGAKALFWWALWGQVLSPLVFFGYTPETVVWLAPLHWALAGFFGAAFVVSIQVLWYSLPQPAARTMKFAIAWVLFGLTGALGSVLGGYVAEHAGPLRIAGLEFSRYHWLFLIGGLGVLPCFWLLKTFRETGEQPPQQLAAWIIRRWTERRIG